MVLFSGHDLFHIIEKVAHAVLSAPVCVKGHADPGYQFTLIDYNAIIGLDSMLGAGWVMVEKVLGQNDERFDDFAVGDFGRWSIGLRAS